MEVGLGHGRATTRALTATPHPARPYYTTQPQGERRDYDIPKPTRPQGEREARPYYGRAARAIRKQRMGKDDLVVGRALAIELLREEGV